MTETNDTAFDSADGEEEKDNEEIKNDKESSPTPDKESTPADQPTTTSIKEIDILSEQFENYLLIAKSLLKTLKRPRDIEISTNLISKVQRLNDSEQTEVKRNNNRFFRYYLRILKWTSDNQPLDLYQCMYRNQETTDLITESRTWLEDNKSYMALKSLKDGTIVIYGAIADDISAGWQDGGLSILAKRGACSRSV